MIKKHLLKILPIVVFCLLSLVLRLWSINFGLPHSWYADEPEIGEPAIKYTYEIKNIIANNDIYKLVPQSYVYGTFPVYFYTILLMVFSKGLGILNVAFSKMDLYIFMRVINALISFSVIPVFYLLIKRLDFTKRALVLIAGVFLIAFNWKLIVHAHYLNHDIIITLLILISNYLFYRYLQDRHATGKIEGDTVYTILFSIFFGLAVSTKITVLLALPLYLAFFAKNRDFRNLFASTFIIAGVFVVTNPFSWVFIGDFALRLLEMRTKEAGMVFDSVDYSPFKYLSALSWMLTIPAFLLSIFGIIKSFREKAAPKRQFFLLMGLQVALYLIFFSVQGRRVDRWMLPIIPNLIMFSVVGLDDFIDTFKNRGVRCIGGFFLAAALIYYLYFPALLLIQFQRNTPKSASYIWAQENLPETSTKFGITEEGLDPLNKLPFSTIWQFNVYESDGAQLIYPPDPLLYDYIMLSSRPMSWSKKPEVVKKYPYYAGKWKNFELSLNNQQDFALIKSFEVAGPNLIPLSNVYVYKNLHQ